MTLRFPKGDDAYYKAQMAEYGMSVEGNYLSWPGEFNTLRYFWTGREMAAFIDGYVAARNGALPSVWALEQMRLGERN